MPSSADDGNQLIPQAVSVGGVVPATLDGGPSLTLVVSDDLAST